ncbi:hypothetical protein [Odoribacter splanchnicus]|uniref:hypothetical protein n=1 Tax=Odoribacter splanchnicus TaxID=28118 RepID=UPI0032C02689
MERFFRNLLLGENNELRNRYMVVNVPKELVTEQAQHDNRTSTEQPTVQVTEQVLALLLALSNEQLSLKSLMERVVAIILHLLKDMNLFDKEIYTFVDIQYLIDNGVEESIHLDFKAAGTLAVSIRTNAHCIPWVVIVVLRSQ